jgi:UDP-glucuronate decarboxylase
MVDGLVSLMNSPREVTGPVNLGNPGEFTMIELAKQVMALTDSHCELQHLPLPADDPVRRKPDISRARDVLGWEPTVPLSEGLARTVDYFRDVLNS